MTISVNTNTAALIALQNLNQTAGDLSQVQNIISTGLKVSTAKDNSSVYAIAQKQRADLSSLGAVTDSLNRATSIADVASSAGASISDLLNTLKSKVVAALDPSQTGTGRAALNTDFKSILNQISLAVSSASFGGANLLDGSLTNGLSFLANADATSHITLSTQNLTLGGPNITIAAADDITSVTNATAVLAKLDASIDKTNLALAALGTQSTAIDNHAGFVSKLSDSLTVGIGDLVDANLPAESARLSSLQVKQQLGTQALSIANQSPQLILNLFK